MYKISFTTETVLCIPPIAFYIALYPERDHDKPQQVWQDTLAPTHCPSGPNQRINWVCFLAAHLCIDLNNSAVDE